MPIVGHSVDRFWQILKDEGYGVHLGKGFWEKLPTSAHNIRLISMGKQRCLLYVKESNPSDTQLKAGFWGIAVSAVTALSQQARLPWAVILLEDSEIGGYFFHSTDVLRNAGGQWPANISYRYNYRVREDLKGDLADGVYFQSTKELSSLLNPLLENSLESR